MRGMGSRRETWKGDFLHCYAAKGCNCVKRRGNVQSSGSSSSTEGSPVSGSATPLAHSFTQKPKWLPSLLGWRPSLGFRLFRAALSAATPRVASIRSIECHHCVFVNASDLARSGPAYSAASTMTTLALVHSWVFTFLHANKCR